MRLTDLDTFVQVAASGSFTAAGARLGVPKSTVSRRVARLEAALGVSLLRRSARSIELTDDGRALAERCAPALRELDSAMQQVVEEDVPRGVLVVTTAMDFSQSGALARLIVDYRRRYPAVRVELLATNRSLDLFEERVDIGLRLHDAPLQPSDALVARRLRPLASGFFASPQLAPILTHWDQAEPWLLGHSRDVQPASPSLVANDYGSLAALLVAGAGFAVLPRFVAEPHLHTGALIPVFEERETAMSQLTLVWLRSRQLAPRVRAFVDLAVQHLGRRSTE